MKKSLMLLFVALFACVSVFAGTAPSAKPHSSHVSGEVVSVDAANNSFVIRETLKDKSTKEITIMCETGTKIMAAGKVATLNELTAGDHVTVAYSISQEGKNMAHSVSIAKPQAHQPGSKS
jgi:hypothetical protein